MKAYTFYGWLQKNTRRNDPIGDLAKDVRRDTDFPRDSTDVEWMHYHLSAKMACPEAHAALDDAWALYVAEKSVIFFLDKSS